MIIEIIENILKLIDCFWKVLDSLQQLNCILSNSIMLSYDFISKNIVKIKILSVILFYVIGIICYGTQEGWTFLDTIYFITVTVTTVGYGYFHVDTNDNSMIWFTIFFILIGCPLALYCINEFARNVLIDTQEALIHTIRKWKGLTTELSSENMRKYKLFIAIFSIFILALAGTLFYSGNENWTGTQAFYWVVCTMTTVGYGDLTITKESTRIFAIFFILSIVTTYAVAMNNIFDIWIEAFSEKLSNSKKKDNDSVKFDDKWTNKVLSRCSSNTMNQDRFVLEVLMEINAIRFDDVKEIIKDFKTIANSNGVATKNELDLFAHKMRDRLSSSQVNPLHSDYLPLKNDSNSELHIV